jgi:hypothetical protein
LALSYDIGQRPGAYHPDTELGAQLEATSLAAAARLSNPRILDEILIGAGLDRRPVDTSPVRWLRRRSGPGDDGADRGWLAGSLRRSPTAGPSATAWNALPRRAAAQPVWKYFNHE